MSHLSFDKRVSGVLVSLTQSYTFTTMDLDEVRRLKACFADAMPRAFGVENSGNFAYAAFDGKLYRFHVEKNLGEGDMSIFEVSECSFASAKEQFKDPGTENVTLPWTSSEVSVIESRHQIYESARQALGLG